MKEIEAIPWYRLQRYRGTDSCAMMIPIRRYYQLYNDTDDRDTKVSIQPYHLIILYEDIPQRMYKKKLIIQTTILLYS